MKKSLFSIMVVTIFLLFSCQKEELMIDSLESNKKENLSSSGYNGIYGSPNGNIHIYQAQGLSGTMLPQYVIEVKNLNPKRIFFSGQEISTTTNNCGLTQKILQPLDFVGHFSHFQNSIGFNPEVILRGVYGCSAPELTTPIHDEVMNSIGVNISNDDDFVNPLGRFYGNVRKVLSIDANGIASISSFSTGLCNSFLANYASPDTKSIMGYDGSGYNGSYQTTVAAIDYSSNTLYFYVSINSNEDEALSELQQHINPNINVAMTLPLHFDCGVPNFAYSNSGWNAVLPVAANHDVSPISIVLADY